MTQTNLSIVFSYELDALFDAGAELLALHEKLFTRHGEDFRQLQRDIEAIGERRLTPPTPTWLDNVLVFGAPPELTDLLRRGRALGVI